MSVGRRHGTSFLSWSAAATMTSCARCSDRCSGGCSRSPSACCAPARSSWLLVDDPAGAAAHAAVAGCSLVGACWAVYWRPARRRRRRRRAPRQPAAHDRPAVAGDPGRRHEVRRCTLITAYGRFTAWAAPAPGLRQVLLAGREEAQHLPPEHGPCRRDPARRPAVEPVGQRGVADPAALGGAARCRPPRRPATRARAGSGALAHRHDGGRRRPARRRGGVAVRLTCAGFSRRPGAPRERAGRRPRGSSRGPCAWGSASGAGRTRRGGRRR